MEGEEVKKVLMRDLRGEGRMGAGRISGERIRKWEGGGTGKAFIQVADDGENAISELAFVFLILERNLQKNMIGPILRIMTSRKDIFTYCFPFL